MARTEDKKPAATQWREPVDRVLKKKVENESKYAVAHVLRYGNWQPSTVTDVKQEEKKELALQSIPPVQPPKPAPLPPPQPVIPESVMQDTEMKKAIPGRKKINPDFYRQDTTNPELRQALEKMARDKLRQSLT